MADQGTTLILRPTKWSAIWLLVICTTFVVLGLMMAHDAPFVGYSGAAFFGLGIPIAIVKLLPGSTYLRISADGIAFASLFRVTTIPWSDIDRFMVMAIRHGGLPVRKMVGFNYVPSYDRARRMRRVNLAIAQCEGALPDTYGKKAEELAELLNNCLQLATVPKVGPVEGVDAPVQ